MKFFGAVFLLLLFNLSSLGEVATAAPLQIGYIPVESIEKGNQIAQVLLKNKLAMNPVVVPILKQDPKNPDPKAAKASNPPHLLLIETSALLIDHVKYVVAKAHKGSKSPPQVTFSPVSSSTPYLGVTVKDAYPQAEEENGLIQSTDTRTISLELEGPTGIEITAELGKPFAFHVTGTHKGGYFWTYQPSSTTAFSYYEFEDGAVLGSINAVRITPHQLGKFNLKLIYDLRSHPTGNPEVKTVTFDVVAK